MRDRVDVLIYGMWTSSSRADPGIAEAWGPMPYKKTPQTPSHGTPAESDDITGASAGRASRSSSASSKRAASCDAGQRLGASPRSGIVRGVAAPRRPSLRLGQGDAATRTPGAHLR